MDEQQTRPAVAPAVNPCLAWVFKSAADLAVKFLPADQFAWEELTAAYNQTRVDYIVPMPMNVARLREYSHIYDVSLADSVVAVEDDQIVGLAMLGVRGDHTWPTRLGVLPISRQRGLGHYLMGYLVAHSCEMGARYSILEVIKGNEPAHRLFYKLGYRETRELLILRRPPGPPALPLGDYTVHELDFAECLARLSQRRTVPAWLNETPTLEKIGNLHGLAVELPSGGRGWLVYRSTTFQLSHLSLETTAGEPRAVGQALLHALHTRHPAQDTNTENISANDPHLAALYDLNYIESFRRIEMRLDF